MEEEQMSSPYLGILDLLQSQSMGCFAFHTIWKESYRSEIEAHLWTQFEDADNRGNQDAIPLGHVVPWIYDPG